MRSEPICVALVALAAACRSPKSVRAEPSSAAPPSVSIAAVRADASTLAADDLPDPLFPSRPAARSISPLPRPRAGENWPLPRPAKELGYSRTRIERQGVLPCEAPEPGSAVHDDWVHVRPMGQFVAPRSGAVDGNGNFDLIVHFHGHRPARKEFSRSGQDLVLLGVSLGIGAAYAPPFSDPRQFEALIQNVERALSRTHAPEGRPAHARRIALSSWSRGYEAIAEILHQPIAARVDALILLDSLHASRDRVRGPTQLAPFEAFARRAARGETFMVVTHSSIDPEPYASTTETAHFLVRAVGGEPVAAVRRDPLGLELVDFHSTGAFHERGYAGNGKLDHCAQFGVYSGAISALSRFRQAHDRR